MQVIPPVAIVWDKSQAPVLSDRGIVIAFFMKHETMDRQEKQFSVQRPFHAVASLAAGMVLMPNTK